MCSICFSATYNRINFSQIRTCGLPSKIYAPERGNYLSSLLVDTAMLKAKAHQFLFENPVRIRRSTLFAFSRKLEREMDCTLVLWYPWFYVILVFVLFLQHFLFPFVYAVSFHGVESRFGLPTNKPYHGQCNQWDLIKITMIWPKCSPIDLNWGVKYVLKGTILWSLAWK